MAFLKTGMGQAQVIKPGEDLEEARKKLAAKVAASKKEKEKKKD